MTLNKYILAACAAPAMCASCSSAHAAKIVQMAVDGDHRKMYFLYDDGTVLEASTNDVKLGEWQKITTPKE